MTVQEMHIDLDLTFRSVNSKRYNKLYPEEKDWILNYGVNQFIKNRINPLANPSRKGFEADTKRYGDLEELVTNRKLALPVYRYDEEKMFAFLPSTNFHYISSRSNIVYSCDDFVSESALGWKSVYYCIVPFRTDSAGLYKDFKITLTDLLGNTTVLVDVAGTPYSEGLGAEEESFLIINYTLEILNAIPGIEAKWEKWNGVYYANSFIIITSDPNTGAAYPNATITTTYVDDSAASISSFATADFQVYLPPSLTTARVPNRLIKSSDIEGAEGNYFYKTVPECPTSHVEGDILYIMNNEKFIINSVNVRYIRKPRKISLLLNRSCELNSRVHEEVVNLAAQRLKALLEAPDYKSIINENLIQE